MGKKRCPCLVDIVIIIKSIRAVLLTHVLLSDCLLLDDFLAFK